MSERVTIGDCTLYRGDCRELLPALACDVIVSDPPYGIAYRHGGTGGPVSNTGSRTFTRHKADIAGDDEPFDPTHLLHLPCLLFGANHYCKRLPETGRWHAWDKKPAGGPDDSFADVEFFWTSWKAKSVCVRHLWKGVCRGSEAGPVRRLHPSQKPVVVMMECVAMAPGRVVCDPYMGSASTGVACARLGRPFVGIEIDPAHFATACRRIETACRQGDMLAEVAA